MTAARRARRPKHSTLWLVAAAVLVILTPIAGCGPASLPTDEPPPPADPWLAYSPSLQPWAKTTLDELPSLPAYQLQAELSADGSRLTGHTQVTVPNTGHHPLPELVFRLYPNTPHYRASMTVSTVTVDGRLATGQLGGDGAVLRVVLPDDLQPGAQVTVAMDYAIDLPQGESDYTLFGWADGILSLPGFYPSLAVYDEGETEGSGRWLVETPPLFADVHFSALALYELELTAPAGLVVVASGSTAARQSQDDGWQTWRIVGGPLRDMTLLLSDRWQVASQPAAGATVNSYYPLNQAAAGQSALFHAAAALSLYSDLYGPYPYTELDVVAVPLGYRGMEYSGLVTIGEGLYGPYREQLGFLVAHEVAHQWWYAQVGSDPLTHPWLDEGMAEYAAYDYYRGVYGQAAADKLLASRWQLPVEAIAGAEMGPVARPVTEMDAGSYELLAYARAALFFDAVRRQLGDEAYRTALRTYVDAYRWRVATPDDLLTAAQNSARQDLSPLVDVWLR